MQDNSELKYWIGFTGVPGVGKARLMALRQHFGLLQDAWKAPASELARAGLDPKVTANITGYRDNINLDEQLKLLEKFQVTAIPFESPDYPPMLAETHDCPALIYIRGEYRKDDWNSVAVVGTRRATAYGRQATEDLVYNLALNKITIVSGLAKGIDTIAHRTALEAGGRTIAVFASGLDIVYPPDNLKLAREIMEHGALVSEYPLGTKPKAENFPRRNRILSGLSRGVLVVESGESSGALITVNFALEQNREVFAVPGSIYSPMSKGPNRLIGEGAKLVSNYVDIIEELNLSIVSQQLVMQNVVASDGIESIIMKHISEEPVHVDEICRNSGLDTSTVISTLTVLELNGLIKHRGNMTYTVKQGH
jgi:DNA processing protein